jgi:hypothetical protein
MKSPRFGLSVRNKSLRLMRPVSTNRYVGFPRRVITPTLPPTGVICQCRQLRKTPRTLGAISLANKSRWTTASSTVQTAFTTFYACPYRTPCKRQLQPLSSIFSLTQPERHEYTGTRHAGSGSRNFPEYRFSSGVTTMRVPRQVFSFSLKKEMVRCHANWAASL